MQSYTALHQSWGQIKEGVPPHRLKWSDDCWVWCRTAGNLASNFLRGGQRKTSTLLIQMEINSQRNTCKIGNYTRTPFKCNPIPIGLYRQSHMLCLRFDIATTVFVAVLWVLRNPMPSPYWWILDKCRSSAHSQSFPTLPELSRRVSLVAVVLNHHLNSRLKVILYVVPLWLRQQIRVKYCTV